MQKDRFMLIMLLFILFIIGGIMFISFIKVEKKEITKSDSIKIKESFEKLNNQTNEANNRIYPYVSLENNNPYIYLNDEDVLRELQKENIIILLGDESDAYTRSLMPILTDVLNSLNISEVYYLNVNYIREELGFDDQNNVIVKKEGSRGYYAILNDLEDFLEPYYVKNNEGKLEDTKHKIIKSPTLIVKKNNNYFLHIGTINTQLSGYDKLTTREIEKIKENLTNILSGIN